MRSAIDDTRVHATTTPRERTGDHWRRLVRPAPPPPPDDDFFGLGWNFVIHGCTLTSDSGRRSSGLWRSSCVVRCVSRRVAGGEGGAKRENAPW